MEHRWGERSAVNLPVRMLRPPGIVGWGRLRDVSLTGAFIETSLPLPPLTFLEIDISIAPGGRRRMSGCVVRRTSDGVGVEWCEPSEEGLDAIASLPALAARAVPVNERALRLVR
jgi:hypothetical protein